MLMEGESSPSYMYIVPTLGCLGYLCPGNCDCSVLFILYLFVFRGSYECISRHF